MHFATIARALIFTGFCAMVGSCNDPPKPSAAADASSASASASAPKSPLPADAIPVPSASVMARVNPTNLPAYDGPTGSLEGTLTYVGEPPKKTPTHADPTKCPKGEDVYGKEFRLGDETPEGRKLADAIVVVTGYAGFYLPEQHDTVAVDLDGCAISPRTIAMTFGQRLQVKNIGGDLVAPVLDKARNGALMVAIANAPAITLYARKPGRFEMTDNLGKKYFKNDVFVLLQPLHAVTDLNGHYRIDGIPVGKLKVSATHPAFVDGALKDVEILQGAVVHADLTITRKPEDAGTPTPAPSSSYRLPR